MPPASRRSIEMFQKGLVRPVFSGTTSPRPLSEATEMYDTEFEEDTSDIEDYSGRRSEESVSQNYICHTTCDPNLALSLENGVILLYPRLTRYKLQVSMSLMASTSKYMKKACHQSPWKDRRGLIYSDPQKMSRRTLTSIYPCPLYCRLNMKVWNLPRD